MKKVTAILAVLLVSITLVACSEPTITGRPSDVLEQCQSVSTDKKPTVEVTGYVTELGVRELDDYWSVSLVDSSSDKGIGDVTCFFDSKPNTDAGRRITVTGKANIILSSSVNLFDCTIKE